MTYRQSRRSTRAARSAGRVLGLAAGTARATGSGARGTTSAMQTLPDSTLLGLAATSVGVGAGFYLAGTPRLVVAAGVVPALFAAAAIVLRPLERLAGVRAWGR